MACEARAGLGEQPMTAIVSAFSSAASICPGSFIGSPPSSPTDPDGYCSKRLRSHPPVRTPDPSEEAEREKRSRSPERRRGRRGHPGPGEDRRPLDAPVGENEESDRDLPLPSEPGQAGNVPVQLDAPHHLGRIGPQSYQAVSKERGPESTKPPSGFGKPAPSSPRPTPRAASRMASSRPERVSPGRPGAPCGASRGLPSAPSPFSGCSGGAGRVEEFAPFSPGGTGRPRAAAPAGPGSRPVLPGRSAMKGFSERGRERSPPPARRSASEKGASRGLCREGPGAS